MTKPKHDNTIDLATRLIGEAAKLLAASRPAAPAKQPTASPRVAVILRALGVTVADLHASRNSSTPRGARSVAARRAVVAYLASESLSVVQIAREAGLAESTVRTHMPRC